MSESALDRERKAHQATRDSQQRERLEYQARLELETQFRTTAMNELKRVFGDGVTYLLSVLHQEMAASHPLRGAPSEDTMRVGHSELTSVEAAADKRPSARQRRWDEQITRLAVRLDEELSGSDEKRPPAVEKPRCRHRDCSGEGKRQPFGVKVCGFCARPIGEAA